MDYKLISKMVNGRQYLSQGNQELMPPGRFIMSSRGTEYLEISQVDLAKRLKLSQPAVSQAVYRGRTIAEVDSYSLYEVINL